MFKGASGFHAGEVGGAPPVGTGGIYGGSGTVPTSVVATLTDTLTFASGNVVMGASANLLVGLNEIQLVADKIFNDSGALIIEGNTAGVVLVSNTGEELELSNGIGVTLTGSGSSFWLNTTTTDGIFQFTQANGTVFDGNLGSSLALTGDRTWRLPDASGTIALVGGGGIYDGSGTVPTSVTATITDTITFASGNVVMGTSANLLIGLNELQFVADKIYNNGTALQIEGHTGGVGILDETGGLLEWSAQSLQLAGNMLLDVSTTDSIIKYISANGSAFDGTLGVIGGLTADRTWRLPDADGTIALVGGGGIYGASGTVPSGVVATLTDTIQFTGGQVTVTGAGSTSATTSLKLENSSALATLNVSDNGLINCKMDAAAGSQFILGSTTTNITTFVRTSTTSHLFQMNSSGVPFVYFRSSYSAFPDPGGAWGGVKVGGTNAAPDLSAVFQLDVTDKGFLPPVMTTVQRDAINSGTFAEGLVVYDSTDNELQYYNGTSWISLTGSGGNTLYSADDTIGAGRVATLTDTLHFSGGQVTITGAGTTSATTTLLLRNSATATFSLLDNGTLALGTITPEATALLDLDVTTLGASAKKGFLPPRMTNADMLAIAAGTPATGLIAYDTSNNQWMGYNGTSWVILG